MDKLILTYDGLTYDDFQAWLESYNPSTIVGIAQTVESCPLAWYLQSKNREAAVYDAEMFVDGDYYELPYWAEHFAANIDSYHEKDITAALALACLKDIPNAE